MEKKRRARINDSLEALKQILLESKTTLRGSATRRNGQRTAKLEKADILEMTVNYLQHLHRKLEQANQEDVSVIKRNREQVAIRPADSSCEGVKVTLVPAKLKNGEIVFVVPSQDVKENLKAETDSVWRPW